MKIETNAFIIDMMAKGLTLAIAESMTCGLAAHKLASFKGTSEVLVGSVICYTPEMKCSLLGISERLIEKYSCESKEVTEQLALHLKKLVKADVYAAITGLASAGGSETKSKPVGTVFLSIMYKNKVYNHRIVFRGTPLQIRNKACVALYRFVRAKVL